ncbi:MAG: TonB-dependent siderophore receptor [Cyanobacteria bacterium P01_G01_bin.54]
MFYFKPTLPLLVLAASGVVASPARSQDASQRAIALKASQFQPPATTVTEWRAQIDAALVQITEIRVEPTENGLQVVLAADGVLFPPSQSVSGNALVLEIPNATLAEQFRDFAPAEGIALVQATEQPGDRVQVTITGSDAVPVVEISANDTGLLLGVMPGVAQANTGDDSIRILVTGEEDDYAVPNSTTATRTDTLLRDTPQSIQVIPQEVFEDQQLIGLNEAIRNVSGAVINEADPRGFRFTLRGFEGASVLRDGFPLSFGDTGGGNGDFTGFPDLSNIERLEVLKGPASILFGVVEPGGVLNLVSKKPTPDPFVEIELLAGNRSLFSPKIDISGPLSENGRAGYRLNALYRNEDYFRDYNLEVERTFVAPTFSLAAGEDTDIDFFIEYLKEERPADFGIVAVGTSVADIPYDRVLTELNDSSNIESTRLGYSIEHRFNDNLKLRHGFAYTDFHTELDYATPSIVVSAFGGLLGLTQFDEETGVLFRDWVYLNSPSQTYTLQNNIVGEFTTGEIEHKVLAGVDFTHRRAVGNIALLDVDTTPAFFGTDNRNQINVFNPEYGRFTRPDRSTMTTISDSDTYVDRIGFYLQDQITIQDNLKLLIGGRYDRVNQSTTNRQTLFFTAGTTKQEDDAFSPRLGVVYQPVEDISLYSSYSQSFSPNSGTTSSGESLEPERGEQFEVGIRAELLDDKLIANLAYFNITKRNIETTDPDNSVFDIAIGEQKSEGIEFDLIGEVMPGWNIIANFAYINARTTEDNDITVGNRLRGVPDTNINFWTTYEVQSGDLEGLSLGVGFNAVSERQGDTDNTFTLDDYFLTNAAIGYSRDNWRVGLNFRNIFDVEHIEGTQSRLNTQPGAGFTMIGSFAIEF